MTCAAQPCTAPACAGRPWRAASSAPGDVAAFTAEAVALMRASARPLSPGQALARVYAQAMAESRDCLFR